MNVMIWIVTSYKKKEITKKIKIFCKNGKFQRKKGIKEKKILVR